MGEAQYYFQARVGVVTRALALLSVYSAPDEELLNKSFETVWVSTYLGNTNFRVIDVKDIISVVAMVPFEQTGQHGQFFMVEKFGLEVGQVAGSEELVTNE